jgi:hypothetical protein
VDDDRARVFVARLFDHLLSHASILTSFTKACTEAGVVDQYKLLPPDTAMDNAPVFRPLPPLEPAPHNLPSLPAGLQQALTWERLPPVLEAVRRGTVRVCALVGSEAGVGTSWAALSVAWYVQQRREFRGGIAWVGCHNSSSAATAEPRTGAGATAVQQPLWKRIAAATGLARCLTAQQLAEALSRLQQKALIVLDDAPYCPCLAREKHDGVCPYADLAELVKGTPFLSVLIATACAEPEVDTASSLSSSHKHLTAAYPQTKTISFGELNMEEACYALRNMVADCTGTHARVPLAAEWIWASYLVDAGSLGGEGEGESHTLTTPAPGEEYAGWRSVTNPPARVLRRQLSASVAYEFFQRRIKETYSVDTRPMIPFPHEWAALSDDVCKQRARDLMAGSAWMHNLRGNMRALHIFAAKHLSHTLLYEIPPEVAATCYHQALIEHDALVPATLSVTTLLQPVPIAVHATAVAALLPPVMPPLVGPQASMDDPRPLNVDAAAGAANINSGWPAYVCLDVQREAAEALLQGKEQGVFLVRGSKTSPRTQYIALSAVLADPAMFHAQIKRPQGPGGAVHVAVKADNLAQPRDTTYPDLSAFLRSPDARSFRRMLVRSATATGKWVYREVPKEEIIG